MKVVALAGGVGGAKLADGLARILSPEDLTIIVNTGDDFYHYDLKICPDLDTVCYTLAGMANPITGWGVEGESWNAFDAIKCLGGPDWFHLGDKDLGTHLERTRRLALGEPLSLITQNFCQAWGVSVKILPMTDCDVCTHILTMDMGWLTFQEYFVKYQCVPVVKFFEFRGSSHAPPAPEVLQRITEADLVIICPSNPWVSIGAILSIPAINHAIRSHPNVMAVSPIIGGKAIKGPAAKMFSELGKKPCAKSVAEYYQEYITGFVFDRVDAKEKPEIENLGIIPYITNTLMLNVNDRVKLATDIIDIMRVTKGSQ